MEVYHIHSAQAQQNSCCIANSIVYRTAQSRNRDDSRIVLDKVGILTLWGEVGIPTWHGSIPELSQPKVGIGTKLESIVFTVQSRNRGQC